MHARTYNTLQNSEGGNRHTERNLSAVSVTDAVFPEGSLTLFSDGKALKRNNSEQTRGTQTGGK